MKIGLLQYNSSWEDKEANKRKILEMLVGIEEVELLIFPEMSLTGFSMEPEKIGEGIGGPSFRFFSELSVDKKSNVIAGIVEKRKERFYNTLIHVNPDGKLVKLYRKIHPFSYSGEEKYYRAGVRPAISKIRKWKIGLTICYDLRFPELFRKYGKKQVQLIVNIANWPDTRIQHWRTLLKARAIENQCYIVAVNRVGDDPKLHYIGFSSVFDPMGEEIVSVENEERVIIVDLDKKYVNEIREKFPFLNDIKLI